MYVIYSVIQLNDNYLETVTGDPQTPRLLATDHGVSVMIEVGKITSAEVIQYGCVNLVSLAESGWKGGES